MTQFSSTWLALHNAKNQTAQVKACGVSRESDLHESIFAECRRRGWIAFHGMMAERTHRTAGEPDFTILAQSKVIFIECKTRTGKLSPTQLAIKAHAAKLGHTIYVVRSMADFFSVLNDLNIGEKRECRVFEVTEIKEAE